jgi:methyl-accepting chemotaxis protein
MNTRKTVYDKLFTEKVELAKHEVELASIDEIQNRYSELYKKHFGKASNLISEAKNELRTFIDEMESLSKEGVDIAKKAKDLGINVESIPNYNDVMKRIARDKMQAMEDLTKTLAKYR